MLIAPYMPAAAGLAGNAPQYAQIGVQAGGSIATSVAAAAHWTAAVPLIGVAVAGVSAALALWFSRKGPQQKVATTKIVDDLEANPQYGLAANLKAYMAGPRTRSSQAAALKNFDDVWMYLVSQDACGNPDMGNPGKACIADRQRGGKWDWFDMYRDPIANDAQVREDTSATTELVAGAFSDGSSPVLPLIGAALLIVGVLL